MAEVEPQPTVGHERTGLVDVLANDLAQCPVQEVRAGVVLADSFPSFPVDRQRRVLAELHGPRGHDAAVTVESGDRELRVPDFDRAGLGDDGPCVADLATGLGVERRAIEEDLDLAALFGTFHRLPFRDDRQDPPGAVLEVVAGEAGLVDASQKRSIGVRTGGGVRASVRSTSTLPLRIHHAVELGEIDLEPALGNDLLGEFLGESERVVQLERGLS